MRTRNASLFSRMVSCKYIHQSESSSHPGHERTEPTELLDPIDARLLVVPIPAFLNLLPNTLSPWFASVAPGASDEIPVRGLQLSLDEASVLAQELSDQPGGVDTGDLLPLLTGPAADETGGVE